jgi:predicted metal-dependent phosphoesterase TrpH
MYAIDLHTHSIASPDGSLNLDDYKRMLENGPLDVIAITDHDTISFAEEARARLGDRIIIGEEISSEAGDIIGLYLTEAVPAGLSLVETVRRIRAQGGLVYIPHPFETVRKGVQLADLEQISGKIDIVEGHNGRAVFQNRAVEARGWALAVDLPSASSSDAHGWHGWGRAYSVLERKPTRDTLAKLLAEASLVRGYVRTRGVLYPKFNRVRKLTGKHRFKEGQGA